jgi:GTP-binding protein
VLPDDYQIADYLRATKKPVIMAVNKLDNPEDNAYEFYSLGLGEPYPISAEHSKGIGDLLDAIVANFNITQEEEQNESMKIAVVGKPNAGKSSLVNKLLGYDRTIVSDIAGTTRDAIDTPFNFKGKEYTLIDTAGIRRQESVEEDVEYYSVVRALAAIRRADVVLLVIDSATEITEQDVKIAGYIHEQGKPSVILMNKWDTIEKDSKTVNVFNKKLDAELKFMDYYRPLYISAKTGQRIDRIMEEAEKVYANAARRVSTGTLNDVLNNMITVNEPPTKNGRKLKIYYCTQVSTNPPTFVFFVNDSTLIHFSYKRYLENGLRSAFDFSGTPVKMIIRNKEGEE